MESLQWSEACARAVGLEKWKRESVVEYMYGPLILLDDGVEQDLNAKTKFWRNAIENLCKIEGIVVLNLKEVSRFFRHPEFKITPDADALQSLLLRHWIPEGIAQYENDSGLKNHSSSREMFGWIWASIEYISSALRSVVNIPLSDQLKAEVFDCNFIIKEVIDKEAKNLITQLPRTRSEAILIYEELETRFVQSRSDLALSRGLVKVKKDFRAIVMNCSSFQLFQSGSDPYIEVLKIVQKDSDQVIDKTDLAIATLKNSLRVCSKTYLALKELYEKRGLMKKKSALLNLRRTLQKCENCIELIVKLDDAFITKSMLNANKITAEALKEAVPDVDEVENVVEELNEAFELSKEVDNILSEPLSSVEIDLSDDDLMLELEKLEGDVFHLKLNSLPHVPVSSPKRQTNIVGNENGRLTNEENTQPIILNAS